jgi:hypothetical protein
MIAGGAFQGIYKFRCANIIDGSGVSVCNYQPLLNSFDNKFIVGKVFGYIV